jgi:hypothetical protein
MRAVHRQQQLGVDAMTPHGRDNDSWEYSIAVCMVVPGLSRFISRRNSSGLFSFGSVAP